ncbi:MAG: hypothetical protein ACSNEK_01055 [Parachlamydiaceae bacterium]
MSSNTPLSNHLVQGLKSQEIPPANNPSLLDDPEVKNRLENFCILYCPGVDIQDMVDSIRAGEELEEFIKTCSDTATVEAGVKKLEDKPAAVKNLMWLLMAKTAATNELYTSGSILLSDKDHKVEAFIKACGGSAVYLRGSTHMQEYRIRGEQQLGLDLRNVGLPANKRTLLFHKLDDGTLFLKMEERGFTPFWRKNFRNFSNVAEFLGHCGTWVHTRFKRGGIGIKEARKEHVPKKTKKAFSRLMRELQENNNFIKSEIKKEIKEGSRFGLAKMDIIIGNRRETLQNSSDSELIETFQREHLMALERAKAKGYDGLVKGNEVHLPSLGSPLQRPSRLS